MVGRQAWDPRGRGPRWGDLRRRPGSLPSCQPAASARHPDVPLVMFHLRCSAGNLLKAMNSAPSIDVHNHAETLVAAFARAGYDRVWPAILQPAEPFFDLSGEDMRRHMYLVTDTAGREFCLRPDIPIPVARDYLSSTDAPRPANFCYLGPVFRDSGAAA